MTICANTISSARDCTARHPVWEIEKNPIPERFPEQFQIGSRGRPFSKNREIVPIGEIVPELSWNDFPTQKNCSGPDDVDKTTFQEQHLCVRCHANAKLFHFQFPNNSSQEHFWKNCSRNDFPNSLFLSIWEPQFFLLQSYVTNLSEPRRTSKLRFVNWYF